MDNFHCNWNGNQIFLSSPSSWIRSDLRERERDCQFHGISSLQDSFPRPPYPAHYFLKLHEMAVFCCSSHPSIHPFSGLDDVNRIDKLRQSEEEEEEEEDNLDTDKGDENQFNVGILLFSSFFFFFSLDVKKRKEEEYLFKISKGSSRMKKKKKKERCLTWTHPVMKLNSYS